MIPKGFKAIRGTFQLVQAVVKLIVAHTYAWCLIAPPTICILVGSSSIFPFAFGLWRMPFVWSTWLYIHTIQSQQKNPVTFLSPYKPPFLWWCQLNIPINCYNRPPESVMQKIKAPKPSPRNTSTPQKAHRSCPPSSLDVESTRHRQSIQWYARWGKCWGELLNKHHLLHKFWRSSCYALWRHNIAVCWCFRWRSRSSRLLSQNHYANVVSLRRSGLDNCHRPSNVASKKHCRLTSGMVFSTKVGLVEYHRYSGEMI